MRTHSLFVGVGNSWAGFNDRSGDHGEAQRGSRGETAGTESGSSFVERITVNTGYPSHASAPPQGEAAVIDSTAHAARGWRCGEANAPRSVRSPLLQSGDQALYTSVVPVSRGCSGCKPRLLAVFRTALRTTHEETEKET